VVKGVWPKKNAAGEFIYPPGVYRSMNHLVTDSLKQPVDTIPNYLESAGHIYEVTEEGLLEKGYHYILTGDTFLITKTDTFILDLGRNAFLREINEGFYALNILNQAVGQESRWWQIVLFERNGNNIINIWHPSYKFTESHFMFYSKKNNYYFNSEWNASEMTGLIKQGAFEKCGPLKRLAGK
jgi:hypothetical protein